MIDINGIPDEKPRKGPHRMSKSKKCAARYRYKEQMRRRRELQALLPHLDLDFRPYLDLHFSDYHNNRMVVVNVEPLTVNPAKDSHD